MMLVTCREIRKGGRAIGALVGPIARMSVHVSC